MFKSWKTTVAGAVAIGAQFVAFRWPEYAGVAAKVTALMTGLGLLAARDNNVTSEQAGAGGRLPKVQPATQLTGGPNTGGANKVGTNYGVDRYLSLMAIGLGLVVLGSGCAWGGNAVKAMRELAKDPATLSLRIRQPTPWGTFEGDLSRSGQTTNYAVAGSGNVTVGSVAKKAQGE